MKKQMIMLLGAICGLCACGTPGSEASDSTPQTEDESAVLPEETAEPDTSLVWIKEPSIHLDNVYNMEAWPFLLGASIEYTGYPIEWAHNNPKEAEGEEIYRSDAVTGELNGKYGILDYEGNVLYPFIIEKEMGGEDYIPISWQPFEGFIAWNDNGSAGKFSPDFTRRSFVMPGGVGGYAPMPIYMDGQLFIEDPETMELTKWTNWTGSRTAVDRNDADRNVTGCAVVSRDSEVIAETDGYCDLFVNGFLSVNENGDWLNPGKKGFLRVSDQKEITDGPVYEDAMYFEDGYAPVKTDGKWAFIDEDGQFVSDPVFDGVSALNNGRAWVLYNGLWGILDVRAAAEKGVMIDAEALKGDYQETELIMPELHENEPVGTLTVRVSNLNIRSLPSSSFGEKKGKAENGKTYDVYEIYDYEEYTWYRIGEDEWVAGGKDWVSYREH